MIAMVSTRLPKLAPRSAGTESTSMVRSRWMANSSGVRSPREERSAPRNAWAGVSSGGCAWNAAMNSGS